MNKLRSSYDKCVKLLFGYQHSYSVTAMLFELAIPTLNPILINSKQHFIRCCNCVKTV